MNAIPSRIGAWLRLAPAFGALTVILGALIAGGGNSAAAAAGIAALLALILLAAMLIAPAARLREAVAENGLSIAGFGLFVAYGAVTALPAPEALAHPLYDALGVGGGAMSLNPTRTWEGLAKLFGPATAFGVGALAVTQSSDRDRIGRLLVTAGLIYALYALGDYVSELGRAGHRLDAGLGSANAAATVLGLFVLIAITAALRATRRPLPRGRSFALAALGRAPVSFALLFTALTGLLLTASRAGVVVTIMAALGLAAMVAYRPGKGRAGGSALLAACLVLGLVVLMGAQYTAERLGATDLSDGRFETFRVHWAAFMSRPWTGHGLNTFHAINTIYGGPDNWAAIARIGATHNVFLQHLEEAGLIGMALFALILVPPVWRAVAAIAGRRSGHAWTCLAVSATLLVFAHGMTDFGLNVPAIAALYALILGAYSRRNIPRG